MTTEQTDTYPYKAHLETILYYGTEVEETFLKLQEYYSALDYSAITLMANQLDRATPHADYEALIPERKKAVNGALDMRERTTGGKPFNYLVCLMWICSIQVECLYQESI